MKNNLLKYGNQWVIDVYQCIHPFTPTPRRPRHSNPVNLWGKTASISERKYLVLSINHIQQDNTEIKRGLQEAQVQYKVNHDRYKKSEF